MNLPKGRKGVDRACDFCRRRKTRCDGGERPNNICTNCVQNRGGRCTYLEESKPRGPPKAYVTQLEDRVEEVEKLLREMHPEIDVDKMFGPAIVRGSWKSGEWSRRVVPIQPPVVPGGTSNTRHGAGPTYKDSSARRKFPASATLLGGAGPPGPFFLPPIITDAGPSENSRGGVSGGGSGSRSGFAAKRQQTSLSDEESDEFWGNFPDFHYESEATSTTARNTNIPLSAAAGSSTSNAPPLPPTTSTYLPVPSQSSPDQNLLSPRPIHRRRSAPGLGRQYGQGTYFGKIESSDVGGGFDPNRRFYGETSSSRLVMLIRDWKREFNEEEEARKLAGGQVGVVGALGQGGGAHEHGITGGAGPMQVDANAPQVKRERDDGPVTITDGGIAIRDNFWKLHPWEASLDDDAILARALHQTTSTHFPPPDLTRALIDLFFTHLNLHFPLLHRPTFERQLYAQKLYERDTWFARCCLLVFAVASRWSDDRRVLWGVDMFRPEPPAAGGNAGKGSEEDDLTNDWLGAGWKFFIPAYNIPRARRELLKVPSLFEIQAYSLMGMFLRGTAFASSAWLAVATGIYKALDAGIHRRPVYPPTPTVESELWKRAFWVLVAFDRTYSPYIGKPNCSNEEDFDLELPLEVDDEYWENEDPALAFKQPPGKPSTVCMFTSWLKLCQILAYCTRTLYCINSSKSLLRLKGADQEEEVVRRLNEACTKWYDSVPVHLRQSTKIDNVIFANQSATLYTAYYSIRLSIMRPTLRYLIPSPSPSAQGGPGLSSRAFSLQTLAEATKVAIACIRLNEAQIQRGLSNISLLITTSQINASILLLYVWAIKTHLHDGAQAEAEAGEIMIPADLRSLSESVSIEKALRDARKCIAILELVREKWVTANVHLNILKESWPKDEAWPFVPSPPQTHRYPPQPQRFPAQHAPEQVQVPWQTWAGSHPSAGGRSSGHRVDTTGAGGTYSRATPSPSEAWGNAQHQPPDPRDPGSETLRPPLYTPQHYAPSSHGQAYPPPSIPHPSSAGHAGLVNRASMPNLTQNTQAQVHFSRPRQYTRRATDYQESLVYPMRQPQQGQGSPPPQLQLPPQAHLPSHQEHGAHSYYTQAHTPTHQQQQTSSAAAPYPNTGTPSRHARSWIPPPPHATPSGQWMPPSPNTLAADHPWPTSAIPHQPHQPHSHPHHYHGAVPPAQYYQPPR